MICLKMKKLRRNVHIKIALDFFRKWTYAILKINGSFIIWLSPIVCWTRKFR